MIQIFSQNKDNVINSVYITAVTTYKVALKHIVPLMDKLAIQRKIQKTKFYDRLAKDLVDGCIMPPLTLAFVDNTYDSAAENSLTEIQNYINNNLDKAFVLDGIQRLNTLKKASLCDGFDNEHPIFFTILICPSNDKLLYRMITLNNGQKPMSTRHQVEMLLANRYDFTNDTIQIVSEKEGAKHTSNEKISFKKSSFINAYLSFLSNTINFDNKKIIEEKLDELLGIKIMDNGVNNNNVEFKAIIQTIAKFSQSNILKRWFQNENNLIGFCVACREKEVFESITNFDSSQFEDLISLFDSLFDKYIEKSKIKVGTFRRKIFLHLFKKINIILENNYDIADLAQILIDDGVI